MIELAQARTLGLLILDAARPNPFRERLARASPVPPGLSRIDTLPDHTLVALATRADAVPHGTVYVTGQGSGRRLTEAGKAEVERRLRDGQSDAIIAAAVGVDKTAIAQRRRVLGLPAVKAPRQPRRR